MKQEYIPVKIEVIRFASEDVITDSRKNDTVMPIIWN